jgi:predicted P-loop ATPase
MRCGEHEAVEFLERLRPGGPWVLTAIVPDGDTVTTTVKTAEDVCAFVEKYDGERNLYYSVNPCRRAMSSKARKVDIGAVEYALADLDPEDDESPEAAKERYLKQFNGGSFKPRPTVLVDSGNGLQGLWRLEQRIELGQPVKNGKELEFSAKDKVTIDDVEDRIAAIMQRLGAKAGTQNIDRILRLPGTINLPNAAKLRAGRKQCPTKLIWFEDTAYKLEAFSEPAGADKQTKKTKGDKKAAPASSDDKLEAAICERGVPKGERSERVWHVVCEMLRRGYLQDAIVKVLLDRDNGISDHICDQSDPRDYAKRQVEHAKNKIHFVCDKDGHIINRSPANIRIALAKLGVAIRYDMFADRMLVDGLPDFGPALEDAAVNRLWLTFGRQFHFYPELELMRIVVSDTGRINQFHPVRDYLDGLTWDGKPRLDKWLVSYAGAEDNEYTRAVGALFLIAAVRRVRQPGCKFDEMLVIEQPLQGTDKSSALAVLAVNEDWFGDDLPLNVDEKKVIETLRGRWIIEAAELSGLKKADVEHLKAFLSRRRDRARMAYGRLPIEAARQSVVAGTTNKFMYLRDVSGNRRFWPVLIERFNLPALRRDRDQLWAETAAREAKGESIRLAPELWPVAGEEQQQRLADDPYVEVLREYIGDLEGKIKAMNVWLILDLRGSQLTQEAYVRMSEAMKRIGWVRPNKSGMLRFGGEPQSAFVRGDPTWEIKVLRDRDGLTLISEKAEAQRKAEQEALAAERAKREEEARKKNAEWAKKIAAADRRRAAERRRAATAAKKSTKRSGDRKH